MKMTCYLCESAETNLFPIPHRIGKINTTIYVCRKCREESENDKTAD